ncbi:MAG TPA: TonB-dependent receptor [Steroidobacteraceae bacterium]|nr:TonB-dependent receptor [Steroidobacteraceae bacterium]
MNSKISYAVAAVLAGASLGAHPAEPAASTTGAGADTLEEVVVTAQRRSENMQDVPISMQAFTGQALQQLNVSTLEDYIKFLPAVTSAANGPGQNEVFMRGLSAGSQASQGSGSTGLWPNVAIYLDNQSGQLPNRNLDIYAIDLNRIEVLEGPQGTLFGAGAEAGAVRYITNEPKLDKTEFNVEAGYGVTAHGAPNSKLTAVLNFPVVPDTMAVRAAIYQDKRGGYIDNVPATFTRKNTDIGIHYAYFPAVNGVCPDGLPNNGYCVPAINPSIDNSGVVGNDINPIRYRGIRAEVLYKFNEDWDLLISQTFQDMDAQGVFYQQPNASDGAALQPLQVTLFNPTSDLDKFSNTAWTVNGKFGNLKAVYTGGYLERNVEQTGDYTNYARGYYADYYQCFGPDAYTPAGTIPTCFSPRSSWHESERNEHWQHEFRLSTPDEWRVRGIAGVYYEDNKLYDVTAWNYKSVPACTTDGLAAVDPGNTDCFTPVGTFPGSTVQHPGVQSPNTSFYQDQVRDTKQTAIFASVDFDVIPKVLTATVGTRHFKFENSLEGSVLSSFFCFQAGAPPDGCHSTVYPIYSFDLNANNLHDTESGFKSRANLTWHVTPDVMVYYTFSQGFRPGGFNQNGGAFRGYNTSGVSQFILRKSYVSDQLTNNEIGWKTELFNHRLQWNGAIYQENWDNAQVFFFDPGVVGNIFYDANGQNFLIKGIETSLLARITNGLTVQVAASWLQSRQTNSPQLIGNNPAEPISFGHPITEACNIYLTVCAMVTNPYGPIGSPTANAPPLQYSFRGRYDWNMNGYSPFVQVSATHNGHSFTQAGSNPTIAQAGGLTTSHLRFENPAYTTYAASFGVAKDNWTVTVYGENLGDSNASTFISAQQFIVAQTPLRPRVMGVSFGYKM